MKKTIAILLVMAIALVSVFAAIDTSGSTLTLNTTVGDQLIGRLFTNSAPDMNTDFTNGSTSEAFSINSIDLSKVYYYGYKTNLTTAPTVTVAATPLKLDGSDVYMTYTVAVDDGSATSVGDTQVNDINLGLAAKDNAPTSGLRVISSKMTVAVAKDVLDKAAAGSYAATITMNISAN